MKKVFLMLSLIVIVPCVCFAMASEPRNIPEPAASGASATVVTKILTGELVSWTPIVRLNTPIIVRLDVMDANKDMTTVDLQQHTTLDWGTLNKNSQVEIPYFISNDGRNVAYWIKEVSSAETK
jgi:hypothetical protein